MTPSAVRALCAALGFGFSLLVQPLFAQTAPADPVPPERSQATPEVQALLDQGIRRLDAPSQEGALRLFAQALQRASVLNDKPGKAKALDGIGTAHYVAYHEAPLAKHLTEALRAFQESAATWTEVGNPRGKAGVLRKIALVYEDMGRRQDAAAYLQQAAELYQALNNAAEEAATYLLLGSALLSDDSLGNNVPAPEEVETGWKSLERARAGFKDLGDRIGEAKALYVMGSLCFRTGQMAAARSYAEQAVSAADQTADQSLQATARLSLGRIYATTGEWLPALGCQERAFALCISLGDRKGAASAARSLGHLYSSLGQWNRAQAQYKEALDLSVKAGDSVGEVMARDTLAQLWAIQGQRKEAQQERKKAADKYNQLLKQATRSDQKATYLSALASIFFEDGPREKAIAYHRMALSLFQQNGNRISEAATLAMLGQIWHHQGNRSEAQAYYQKALSLYEKLADPEGQAFCLNGIAAIEQQEGAGDNAISHLQQAVDLLDDCRFRLGAASLQMAYLQARRETYYRYLDLLRRRGRIEEAFAAAQKVKARALLDLMAGKVNIQTHLTEAQKQREQELRRRADMLNVSFQSLPSTTAGTLRSERKEQLRQAERELQEFTEHLYTLYPDLARKRAASTVTLADVERFLPADTALLEYVVLKDRDGTLDHTVLLCVTLEQGKAKVAAYVLRAPDGKKAVAGAQLAERAAAFETACAQRKYVYKDKARDLYSLLIAPAARQIAGKKRLVICPDGPLWGLPFQALVDATGQFVLERYEIAYAYSATGVQAAILAREDNTRSRPLGTLLVLADPVFGDAKSRPLVQRGLLLDRGQSLPRLLETGREAAALHRLFPEARVYTRQEAQESVVKQRACEFRSVLLASHGIFNNAAPLLSAVVLAQPPPRSTEDGWLTAREIFDLDLSGADLVVLSACDTARGQKRSGEGIIGLTWALFAAGSPTQVVSQWRVRDDSTADLMRRFYAAMAGAAPKAKGAALRAAALSLLKEKATQHPYHWAPFVLMGDWR